MPALLLPLLMCAWLGADSTAPVGPLVIPHFARSSGPAAELRWTGSKLYPVAEGTQITAKVVGTMPVPATDPGRTLLQVEVVLPLMAKDGVTILLPAGARLVGQVHLLRGEYRFIDFQSCRLPEGQSIGLPENTFSLGPGSLVGVEEETPVLLTVARPLRTEAFGPAR